MEIASVSKAGQLGNGLEYYLLLQITLQETQDNEGSVVRSGGTHLDQRMGRGRKGTCRNDTLLQRGIPAN